MAVEEDARAIEKADFLRAAGWDDAQIGPLAGDASTRSYERLTLGDKQAVLMNAPPKAEGASCPPEASVAERVALGYNAQARLAGPNMNAFLAIAETLRNAGLSAPLVFDADPITGFALLEDFGDDLFARAIPAGADPRTLYEGAIEALVALRTAAPSAPVSPDYTMLEYDRAALEAEVALLVDWYVPMKTGADIDDATRAAYLDAWRAPLKALSAPQTLVLRDYHAENLFWLPERDGPARIGLIDFQDGLFGLGAYDLVSLLEDARRDVAPELAKDMLTLYRARARNAFDFDDEAFLVDYAVLGAQRNAKILGIFARLVNRDGKDRYLQFLPRVERLFARNLAAPALTPVRAFLERVAPEMFNEGEAA